MKVRWAPHRKTNVWHAFCFIPDHMTRAAVCDNKVLRPREVFRGVPKNTAEEPPVCSKCREGVYDLKYKFRENNSLAPLIDEFRIALARSLGYLRNSRDAGLRDDTETLVRKAEFMIDHKDDWE